MQSVLQAKIFGGHMPTDIDVEKLNQEFGVPTEGQKLLYSDLEKCLGTSKSTSRFRSVLSAWRRLLDKKHNLLLKAIPNIGFEVMTPTMRVSHCSGGFSRGLRRIYKSALDAARTRRDGLPVDEVRVLDHVQNTGASLRLAAQAAARQLKYMEDSDKV